MPSGRLGQSQSVNVSLYKSATVASRPALLLIG
jgi:hypothetical protein